MVLACSAEGSSHGRLPERDREPYLVWGRSLPCAEHTKTMTTIAALSVESQCPLLAPRWLAASGKIGREHRSRGNALLCGVRMRTDIAGILRKGRPTISTRKGLRPDGAARRRIAARHAPL